MEELAVRTLNGRRILGSSGLLLCAVVFSSCGDAGTLTADMPLHLEEHLDVATVIGSEVPEGGLQPIEWHFDEPQPDWRPFLMPIEGMEAVTPLRVEDALRLALTPWTVPGRGGRVFGMVIVEIPDLDLENWAHVEIRARTSDLIGDVTLAFNLTDERPPGAPFEIWVGDQARLIADGTVQTYRMSLDHSRMVTFEGPWTHLGIWFLTERSEGLEKAAVDILSVRVIPRETEYSKAAVGTLEVTVGDRFRRSLYTHAPGRLEYPVRIPKGGRLDLGFGVLRDDVPVTFRVEVQPPGETPTTLLEERYADNDSWGSRSVDLTEYAGQSVTLALEVDSERAGTVAFWGSPTVSGPTRVAEKPNIIFYVIDGAGAEYMSLYGYNRRTTPNIDRLAAEGAVFEWAYSNSSWTRPSTASFMTSLQHSVLGGFVGGFNVVPVDVPTMAQHLHRAGYQTSVFSPNPNSGRMSGLEREVDSFRETWEGNEDGNQSSMYAHQAFWKWRENYPGQPYWVHFQTIDIHEQFPASAPFSGLFVGPEEMSALEEWLPRLREEGGRAEYSEAYEKTGISRVAHFTLWQALYDETMAHNDYQIGRLVERLKAEGEWENTLLILGSDHSISAAVYDMAIAIQDSLPPRWSHPIFRPSIGRIPLIFVWPGHIEGGQHFDEPAVSMIDVLPTILDLAGLPLPEVTMGQSLAPLLLGEGEVETRPVILDEFEVDAVTGEFRGVIEVVDGRWGASLGINQRPPEEGEPLAMALERRPVPLLLYDLWNDPYCLYSIHEKRPDLVEKYTTFLEEQWENHLALGRLFTPSETVPLTSEQLERLRALGYIR